jgi:hypothetical protein
LSGSGRSSTRGARPAADQAKARRTAAVVPACPGHGAGASARSVRPSKRRLKSRIASTLVSITTLVVPSFLAHRNGERSGLSYRPRFGMNGRLCDRTCLGKTPYTCPQSSQYATSNQASPPFEVWVLCLVPMCFTPVAEHCGHRGSAIDAIPLVYG